MYKQRTITEFEARHNFKIYRVVSLLYKLEVIDGYEFVKHQYLIGDAMPAGIAIDWENFCIRGGPGEIIQF